MKNVTKLMLAFALIAVAGCQKTEVSKDQISKILKDNPEIILDVISQHPLKFMETLQKAAQKAQKEMAEKMAREKEKEFEKSFDNPLKPEIRKDDVIRGTMGAPLVLVEYSDFECPFCSRGFKTVKDLMKKYEGKIQFVYKHLPLAFHKNAKLASQYYEAIRLQDHKKAIKFHDDLYMNQRGLKDGGEKYLKKAAKKLGVNMKKLKKDVTSKAVLDRIEEDVKEASKFNMRGTPGFILNGIPVRGALPADHFVKIVNKLKEKGKVSL